MACAETCDAIEVSGAVLAGADFLPGPVDAHAGIEPAAEFLEVSGRPLPEETVQHPVIRVVRRARHDPGRARGRHRGMDDVGLLRREIGNVASRIVEEDREVVEADLVQRANLREEIRLRRAGVVAIELEGAQADAEAHAEASAVHGKRREPGRCRVRMALAPPATQEVVRLRRVVEEGKAEPPRPGRHVLSLGVGPGVPEIAFDDAELGNHDVKPTRLPGFVPGPEDEGPCRPAQRLARRIPRSRLGRARHRAHRRALGAARAEPARGLHRRNQHGLDHRRDVPGIRNQRRRRVGRPSLPGPSRGLAAPGPYHHFSPPARSATAIAFTTGQPGTPKPASGRGLPAHRTPATRVRASRDRRPRPCERASGPLRT